MSKLGFKDGRFSDALDKWFGRGQYNIQRKESSVSVESVLSDCSG